MIYAARHGGTGAKVDRLSKIGDRFEGEAAASEATALHRAGYAEEIAGGRYDADAAIVLDR